MQEQVGSPWSGSLQPKNAPPTSTVGLLKVMDAVLRMEQTARRRCLRCGPTMFQWSSSNFFLQRCLQRKGRQRRNTAVVVVVQHDGRDPSPLLASWRSLCRVPCGRCSLVLSSAAVCGSLPPLSEDAVCPLHRYRRELPRGNDFLEGGTVVGSTPSIASLKAATRGEERSRISCWGRGRAVVEDGGRVDKSISLGNDTKNTDRRRCRCSRWQHPVVDRRHPARHIRRRWQCPVAALHSAHCFPNYGRCRLSSGFRCDCCKSDRDDGFSSVAVDSRPDWLGRSMCDTVKGRHPRCEVPFR